MAAGTPYGALVVVNDRADIASMAGAAGVHVGQEDLPVAMCAEIAGPDAMVGISTHTPEQVDEAVAGPARRMSPSGRSSEPRRKTQATHRGVSTWSATRPVAESR